MPGPPQQTTHGKHSVVIQSVLQCSDICARHFCWNAISFQILSTCQGHLTHLSLSDFRRISRAPMVHQGMLIDWITIRQKTQFEEEVNKTTCPQQPVRLFEHFSPLAGDSAYLDLSETWVPQKSSCSLTKGPFWRTPNLETYGHISIFQSSQPSRSNSGGAARRAIPVSAEFGGCLAANAPRKNWLVDLGFPASTRLLLLMWPFNLQVSWIRAEDTLNIYLQVLQTLYRRNNESQRPLTVGKASHRTGKQLKHRLQTQPLASISATRMSSPANRFGITRKAQKRMQWLNLGFSCIWDRNTDTKS